VTRLTKDRGAIVHDDRLEALSMAVNYWTEQMDTDAETMAAQQKLEAFNGEIQKFIDSATGVYKSAGDRWF
jgi:hypothetical protein|tara:strand:- start:236 stop:448 length:213 start_codon:yes stop_codon:yes gene_type:complete